MGRNRGDERMSSILNCCPLIRIIHISGFRDRPAMRYALLDKVYERVSFSPYKLTDSQPPIPKEMGLQLTRRLPRMAY